MSADAIREFFENQRRADEAMRRAFATPLAVERLRIADESLKQALETTSMQASLREMQKSFSVSDQLTRVAESTSIQASLRELQKTTSISDQARKALERTSLQPFLEDIKKRALLGEQVKSLIESASIQASLPSVQSLLEAQRRMNRDALGSYRRAVEQFNEAQREQLATALAGIDIALAADASAGLDFMVEPIADDVHLDLPDGLLALPIVVANLPSATRVGLVLHLVALILATSFYADALAEESQGRAFLHLVAILIDNYFFYCAILDAIEHEEDELSAE